MDRTSSKCIIRPWGLPECGCEFDTFGNATCKKQGDMNVVSSHEEIVNDISQKRPRSVQLPYSQSQSQECPFTNTWKKIKAIVFVCNN